MTRDEAQEAAHDLLRKGYGFAIMGNVPTGYVDRYYNDNGWHDVDPWNELEERGEPCRIVVGHYREGDSKRVYHHGDVKSHGFYTGQCALTYSAFGNVSDTFEPLETVAKALGCDFRKRQLLWVGGDRLWVPALKPSAHGRGPWHREGKSNRDFTETLIRQRLNPSEFFVTDHEIAFVGVKGEEANPLLEDIAHLHREAAVDCDPNCGFPVTQALRDLITEIHEAAEAGNWSMVHALAYGHKFIGGMGCEPFGEHYRDENCIADYLDGIHFTSAKLANFETETINVESPSLKLIEQQHHEYNDWPLWWREQVTV